MTSSDATGDVTFADCVDKLRSGAVTAHEAAESLIAQMTDGELLWLLDGDLPARSILRLPALIKAGPVAGGAVPRLGIPGIRFSDGPRGVVIGRSTAFPVTIMRAATWDPGLEERVGLAIGREARARGANYSGAVCINLLRHPAWGRAQECYGEDPVLTGRMGAGLTRGLRRHSASRGAPSVLRRRCAQDRLRRLVGPAQARSRRQSRCVPVRIRLGIHHV